MPGLEEWLAEAGAPLPEDMIPHFRKWAAKRITEKYMEEIVNEEEKIRSAFDRLHPSLPNGRKNEAYRAGIAFPEEMISEISVDGLEDTGLEATVGDGEIIFSGTPAEAGDISVIISYLPKEPVPGREPLRRTINFSVNPDPRELWKTIPSDPEKYPFCKADSDKAYVKVCATADGKPRKDIAAASLRGRSHAHEGKPRDDDFRVEFSQDGEWYVMAVADGAGSAALSREGSRIACDAAVEYCIRQLAATPDFDREAEEFVSTRSASSQKALSGMVYSIVGNAAFSANRALRDFTANSGLDRAPSLRDLATTLLLAVCKRFADGWFVASFWVGDGAMAVYNREERSVKLLGTPDGGEYAGQTRFLTMDEIFADKENFYKRLRFTAIEDFTALMLMTDGVSDAKFETDANLNNPACWDRLWEDLSGSVDLSDNNEESASQLLKWLEFWSPGNHDDRTIAILY